MKKDNKGFTIVELLAVLVILITILLIALPSITSTVERNKENMLNKKYDMFEASAETYVSLYKNKINYSSFINGNCVINLNDLVSKGLLTNEDLKDSNGKIIKGSIRYVSSEYIYQKTEGTSC